MEFEQVQQFWDGVAPEQKSAAFKGDPVLRYFDHFSILEVVEGKLLKFDVEKIAELQDKVDKLAKDPTGVDECVREIFAAGSTRNINVRSHKLVKIIKDTLTAICESGDLPAGVDAPAPERDAGSPPHGRAPNSDAGLMDPATDDFQQLAQPVMLRLAADLPPGAQINVRAEPNAEGEIVGILDASSQVLAIGMHCDWARVRSAEFGEAWVLTATPDRALLVEARPDHAASMQQKENQYMANTADAALHTNPAKASAVPAAAATISARQMQHAVPQPYAPPRTPQMPRMYNQDPVLSPMLSSSDSDPHRFVSLEEHNRLRYKVAQLEADMRALRLLLRSWSLDTPSHVM